MEKENNEYIDLMSEQPKQEEAKDFDTGFEFGNVDSSLEGIPTIDLGIGLTDF